MTSPSSASAWSGSSLRAALLAPTLVALALSACDDPESVVAPAAPTASAAPTSAPPAPTAIAGVQAHMSYGAGFFQAPFPGEHRRLADGRPDVSGFPDPDANKLLGRVLGILNNSVDGFGLTSGVFFSLTGAVNQANLPDLAGSIGTSAKVFLINVDPASPDLGKRHPVEAQFLADGGPFGAPNLLSLLPLQGLPLRPRTAYAAVVLRSLGDEAGQPLGVPLAMAELASGGRPAAMTAAAFQRYQGALTALAARGVAAPEVAALTVFVTGDPSRELGEFYDDLVARPLPTLAPFEPREVFDDYCVYASEVAMPVYQAGAAPYDADGGGWARDAQGKPQVQREELARVVVTVPRRPMPAAGYPTVVFSRTGGGGDRPLVDRGRGLAHGGPALVAGSGPAQAFAQAGWGAISIDGPHGGLRNLTGGDEQFLMFNVTNPTALRDNVRQSAIELGLTARMLSTLTLDVSKCPGAGLDGQARHDDDNIALMGHSMGATIAPLALAAEPRFRAALLSGAGGSWIANVIDKKKPLAVRGFMEILLGVGSGWKLHTHDPALSLFQWAGEAADPPVFAAEIVDGARPAPHLLMMQGMVDHYILPSIANATSLSLGLDLGGEALDEQTPEVASFRPLRSLLPLSGRQAIALPASGNRPTASGPAITALVTQHREDGIEDGHEVVFQVPGPRMQYRCFLQSLATGTPSVPPPGAEDDACP